MKRGGVSGEKRGKKKEGVGAEFGSLQDFPLFTASFAAVTYLKAIRKSRKDAAGQNEKREV